MTAPTRFTLPLAPEALPTALRLLRADVSRTEIADVLFDERAARVVAASTARSRDDFMADIEQLSLRHDLPPCDPGAGGCTHLSLRPAPKLSLTVRWTDDCASVCCFHKNRQRYLRCNVLKSTGGGN